MIYLIMLGLGLFFVSSKAGDVLTGYDDLYKKYAGLYNLDWKMLKAISIIESNEGRAPSVAYGILNPSDVENSKSSDGLSWGLMQLTLTTARDYDRNVTVAGLNDPDYSIVLACKHLAFLKKLFSENEWVIKSYNQGQGNSLKEKQGLISGYADSYYKKYLNAYNSISGI